MDGQEEKKEGEEGNENHESEIQQQQEMAEAVSRAQIYGWVPKEEFKGDPGKWVPADVFIKRAEEILPIARSMNKRLEGKLATTEKELEEMRKTVKAVIQAHKKTAETTYEGRIAEIRKEQIKAVAEGDTDTWARLEDEKTKLEKPADIPFEEKGGNGNEAAIVMQWKRDNPWYDTDPELGTYADSVSNFISARHGRLAPEDLLDRVKQEVQRRFPEKFGNQKRRNPPNVDRTDYSTGGGGKDTGKKSYSDLPADAKAACDDLVRQKVLTRDQYVQTYFEG